MAEPARSAAGTAPGPGADVIYALGSGQGEFPALLATVLGLLDEAVKSLREATAVAENAGALPWPGVCRPAAAGGWDRRPAPAGGPGGSSGRDRAAAVAGWPGEPGPPGRAAPAGACWSLRRDGPDWLLHAGPEHARLRDRRGLHYLRALLAAPGADIPALDLAAGGPGLAAAAAEPLLDPAARGAYHRRIRELDGELAAADRAGNTTAADRAHTERQALLTELRRATGLAGRPRRAAADTERARVNVTRTLRAALGHITLAAPTAGAHLQSSIHTGTTCRYQPAPGGPARWHT